MEWGVRGGVVVVVARRGYEEGGGGNLGTVACPPTEARALLATTHTPGAGFRWRGVGAEQWAAVTQ